MVVGEDGTGEESPAVGVRPEPGVTEVDGTVEPVQLLSGAAQPGEGEGDVRYVEIFSVFSPVGHVGMFAVPGLFIKDEMVLTGDEPLHATAALHVLVAGSLHGPLPVPARTVSHGVGLHRITE